MRSDLFFLVCLIVGAAIFAAAFALGNDYYFFAGYVVLQYVVLSTAWNILGGYCGYVNFGSAAFFALGAYSTVAMHKLYPLPIPVLVVIGGIVSGIVGFGMGYLTLRLRGAFFAIATLALAVVLQTLRRQLGLCRRLARRLYHPPGSDLRRSAATSDTCS